jgi:5-(aminomethyl)-3-furanmethanol phosphate kinase
MNDSKISRRVVKVGGSLVDPDRAHDVGPSFEELSWPRNVRRWISAQPSKTTLIVIGGGQAVDDVQAEQRRSGLSDAEAHWRCIRVMGDRARLLAEWMPAWRLVSDPRDIVEFDAGVTLVIEAVAFMEDVDAALGLGALPESWDVSSDSIAARAAELFAADELVLLKSTLPNAIDQLGDYVDPYFAEAARRLPNIRFVNLRHPAFPEVRWR